MPLRGEPVTKRAWTRWILLGSILSPFAVAQAEPASQALPQAEASSAPTAEALDIRLELDASGLRLEQVKAQIEMELGRPVAFVRDEPAALFLRVTAENRLTLRYGRAESDMLERSVDLPEDPLRAAEVIALLIGNVVRDETSELLRSLQQTREPEPSAEALSSGSAPQAEEVRDRGEPKNAPRPSEPSGQPRDSIASGQREPSNELIDGRMKLNVSFIHPLALLPNSERHRLNLELGLLYSRVGAVEGLALNLGVLSIEEHLRGLAIGMLWNETGGPVRGGSIGALWDSGSGPLFGIGLGGAVAHRKERVEGLHAAGGLAVAGDLKGAQFAGGASIAESVSGVSAAGGANVINAHAHGVLVAGGFNVTASGRGVATAGGLNLAGDYNGALVAGGVNIAGRIRGLAIGSVNIIERVEGIQIGAVNIAEEVNGTSIGLVNIAGNGRVQPMVWSSTTLPLHVGMKFVVGYFYSELGWGYSPGNNHHAPEGGAGVHLDLSSVLYVESGLLYSDEHEVRNGLRGLHGDVHYRARVGVRILDSFELFAGAGVRHGVHGETSGQSQVEGHAGLALF